MKGLKIFGDEKAAAITILTGISPRIEPNEENFFVYLFPDTIETKNALKSFFNNVPLPCKDYSILCKFFRQQLNSLKNQKTGAIRNE